MSFNEQWFIKPTVVQLHHGVLLSNKEELAIHKAVWMNLKRTVLSKKINLKKLQDSIYITFLNNKIMKWRSDWWPEIRDGVNVATQG